nr:E3 ubiquitin-protein ligase At1g63170-like [Ipomoea trifida]
MSTARDSNAETSGAYANSGSVDGGGGGGVDTTPLLNDKIFRSRRFMCNIPSLRGTTWFLRRASSRRMMREPSMRVCEAAAEQIEERQSNWAYSKPIGWENRSGRLNCLLCWAYAKIYLGFTVSVVAIST